MSTRHPAASARVHSSVSSRLLPTPASPPNSTLPPGSPPSPTASERVRIVSALPNRGHLVTSDGIPAIMANGWDTLPTDGAVVSTSAHSRTTVADRQAVAAAAPAERPAQV